MRPGRLPQRSRETGAVVPLADLKSYCRIFDDDDDDLLTALAATAQDIIAGHLNTPVGEVTVTDFFRGLDRRLELSARVKDSTSVTVTAKVDGADQDVSGGSLDRSSDPPAVIFADPNFPTLDRLYALPVSARYTAPAFTGAGEEGLVQAIKFLVNEGYHHGGDAMSDPRQVSRAVRFLTNLAKAHSPGRVHL